MVYNFFFFLSLDSFYLLTINFHSIFSREKKKEIDRKGENFTLQFYILFCSENMKIVTLKGVKSGIFLFILSLFRGKYHLSLLGPLSEYWGKRQNWKDPRTAPFCSYLHYQIAKEGGLEEEGTKILSPLLFSSHLSFSCSSRGRVDLPTSLHP